MLLSCCRALKWSMGSRLCRWAILLSVIGQVLAAAAEAPPCRQLAARQYASGSVAVGEDCSWRALPGVRTLEGQLQHAAGTAGPPALILPHGQAPVTSESGVAATTSFTAIYVILDGFQLPDPAASGAALLPAGLTSAAAGSVLLQDVRILVDSSTLQQHVQYFAKQTDVMYYTDANTFLHVNYYATGNVTWQSVGLLLASDLQDARSTSLAVPAAVSSPVSTRGLLQQADHVPAAAAPASGSQQQLPPKYGYVLAATNETLVQHMQHIGAVAGPAGGLIYLDANVTLSEPPVPTGGILVARPLALVGLVRANVSVDLHMEVNQILLNETWSNLTVDRLVVENMAPGDAKSAEIARPLSVSSANNFWSLYYPREQNRLTIKNCTFVVGGQSELDYYLYWATVYHSMLPYFKQLAKFIRDVIKISDWEIADAGDGDSSVLVIRSVAGSCTVLDSVYTVNPIVAPKLPRPPVDPSLQLNTAEKSPLVTAVSDWPSFREQLNPLGPSEEGRMHVVLLRNNITVPPANTSSNSSPGASIPPDGVPVPHAVSILGDISRQEPSVLDLGFARDVLHLPADSQEERLQVQHLTLKGLAQGTAAAAATDLSSPDVWTILAWAFDRSSEKSVSLSACTLEVPPQEFDALKQQAEVAGGQVILKLAGDVQRDGDGLCVLNDIVITGPPQNIMQIGSIEGQGLSATNITLVSSAAAAAIPGGYYWPGGALPTFAFSGTSQLSKPSLAVAIAVPVVVGVALLAAAAAVLIIRQRRQRREHQQQASDVEKAQYGLFGDQLLPPPVGSSGCCQGGRSGSSSSAGSELANSKCASADVTSKSSLAAAGAAAVAAATPGLNDQHQRESHVSGVVQSRKHDLAGILPQEQSDALGMQIAVDQTTLAALGDTTVLADISQQTPCTADGILSITQRDQLWSLAKQLDFVEQQQQPTASNIDLIQVLAAQGPEGLSEGFRNYGASDLHDSSRLTTGEVTTDSARSLSDWHTVGQQRQRQQSGVLAHSMDSAVLAAAAKSLQQRVQQQGLEGIMLHPVELHSQQLVQQGRLDATAAAVAAESPVAAAAGSSVPGSPAKGSATSKPWQRVSSAISTLQQGLTQRRLEAAYVEATRSAEGRSTDDSNPTAAAASGQAAAVAGPADGGDAICQAVEQPAKAGPVQRTTSLPQLQMLEIIGRGTFASVYRAIWRGRCVAVKVVHVPADVLDIGSSESDVATALQTRERMAVMEAVVSITMSHPNIVQVYTFALKPLPTPVVSSTAQQQQQQQQQPTEDGASGWELQLLMEYCAEGSLRQALNQRRLVDPCSSTGLPRLHMVLALAHDVACAMLHLHSENLIHGDLKASNVLLTHSNAPLISSGSGSLGGSTGLTAIAPVPPRQPCSATGCAGSCARSGLSCLALLAAQQAAQGGRLVAKIADFGLSLSLAPGDTHVSHMHAGTLTHMAPELLLHGRASKTSDVYAFGILLWELATGRRAFQGVPVALLGHNVAHLRWRPGWLPGVPAPLKALVEQCWAQEASTRPSFQDVLSRLEQLLQLSPEELQNPDVLYPRSSVRQQQQQVTPNSSSSDSPQAVNCIGGNIGDTPAVANVSGDCTGDWSFPVKQQRQQPQQPQAAAAEQQQQQQGAPDLSPVGGVVSPPGGTVKGTGLTGDWSLLGKQRWLNAGLAMAAAAATEVLEREDQQEQQQLGLSRGGKGSDWTGDWSLPVKQQRQQPREPEAAKAAVTQHQQDDMAHHNTAAPSAVSGNDYGDGAGYTGDWSLPVKQQRVI